MIILVIGDVFGEAGFNVLKLELKKLKKKYSVDLVIANVENLNKRTSKSLSFKEYNELLSLGVNFMTSGNHILFNEDVRNNFSNFNFLVKPINITPYSFVDKYDLSLEKSLCEGSKVFNFGGKKIRITNVLGSQFMNLPSSPINYYYSFQKILEIDRNLDSSDIHLVDFHAETSSEKISFALKFDGQVTAILGTHTHVQTSDERVLNKGTAFITDIGMTGPYEGVIGADPKGVIERMQYGYPSRIVPFNDYEYYQINAIILKIRDKDNKIIDLERINFQVIREQKESTKK